MKAARYWALAGSVGLAVSFTAGMAGQAVAKPVPSRVMLHGSLTPASERAHPTGAAVKGNITFDLLLKLRNATGAKAFVRAVSSPGSKSFHKFLTDKQWMARFGPSATSIAKAESWLRSQGFTGISVPKTHLFVTATGSVAKVEKAFGAQVAMFKVVGHNVHLSKTALSVPKSIAGITQGVIGINQSIATTDLSIHGRNTPAASPAAEPGPPTGFRNPQPCTRAFNTTPDTADPSSLYNPPHGPFSGTLNYDICGYAPRQLRSAYGIAGAVNSGNDGTGVAVGIVDAYDSPTLLADSQRYFKQNDNNTPAQALQGGQNFFDFPPATVDDAAECGGSGWRAEQSLDVQSVHAMAPGATVAYFGAQDCQNTSLLATLQEAITSGVSVVSDSWGSNNGDLFEDTASKTGFDDTFMLADSTGVSVLFSSGDDGDNFAATGIVGPDYPPASPFITAVGGTTLEISAKGHRAGEFGWSVAKQTLCTGVTGTSCDGSTHGAVPLTWNSGGGGGSSYNYIEPFYQDGVVPAALALRNRALFGSTPVRVEPDISMDADAQSGMLIGLTQNYGPAPGHNHYGQFKEGGTSLASPLLAGVLADVDQAAGGPIGFANPVMYHVWLTTPAAFHDVQPSAHPKSNAVVRVDFTNTQDNSDGFSISVRAIDYEGIEVNCDGTGNCESRKVTLNTTKGFDSLTGLGSVGPGFISAMSKF